MATETSTPVYRDVRRPAALGVPGAETFTRARVERIVIITVGFGCSALGTQAFLNALTSSQEDPGWRMVLLLTIFVPLAVMIVGCIAGIRARLLAAMFAVVYPAAILLWPLATAGRSEHAAGAPWIWYLINVATVAAVVAFPLPLQLLWGALVPVLYGGVRLAQDGVGTTGDSLVRVGLDVAFAMILAYVLLTIAWMLRSVSVGIDDARAVAVRSYAEAATADAIEKERVAVAALMHDSVLAALIAAERATTPRERALAVSMAREALTRLANADRDSGEGSDAPVDPAVVADELDAAAAEFRVGVNAERSIAPDAPSVPGRAAKALVLAATQAIANAVQHAGAVGLRLRVEADAAGVTIRISDNGDGFDLDEMADDRLGIRASIFARMTAVAGRAEIDSGVNGTVVTLSWEHPR
ncbi:sensor histidine kinase [Microbacterium sp.]|uniref:sensor histidine kinase n=1 Tax=Microbacterium sp. TaxID=51671 RepID=UPI0039E38689